MSFLFPDGLVNTDDNTYTTTSFAAFGQLIWNINDEFSATLGMRYTYEKKEREGSQTSDPVPQIGDLPPVDLPVMGGYAGFVAPQATYGVTLRWYN